MAVRVALPVADEAVIDQAEDGVGEADSVVLVAVADSRVVVEADAADLVVALPTVHQEARRPMVLLRAVLHKVVLLKVVLLAAVANKELAGMNWIL